MRNHVILFARLTFFVSLMPIRPVSFVQEGVLEEWLLLDRI